MSSVLRNVRVGGPAYLLRHPAADTSPTPIIQGYTDEEMEEARKEAFDAGHAAAWREVAPLKAELEAETQRAVEGLHAAAASVSSSWGALHRSAAADLVKFALSIARLVVRRELATSSDPIVPLLRELLEWAASAERIHVRLSPRDYAFVRDAGGRLPEAASMTGLRFRPDSTLEPGDCIVETEQGNLDARIATQLDRIEKALERAGDEEVAA